MIICNWFSGDSEYMQKIQDSCYLKHVYHIYEMSRITYAGAIDITGEETQLWKLVKPVRELDQSCLQEMHDVMAAVFRFVRINEINNYHFPNVLTSMPDNKYYLSEWIKFFYGSFEKILHRDPVISRYILEIVAYPLNVCKKKEAEEWIRAILLDQFYDLFDKTRGRLKPSDKLHTFIYS